MFVSISKRVAALGAFGLVLAAFPAQAPAATSWEDLSTQTALAAIDSAPAVEGSLHFTPMPAMRPLFTAPTFFANFVTAGQNVSGVVCFNCVNGAGGFNIGLPAPYNVIIAGTASQLNISWTNITYSGPCKAGVSVAAGKTVLGRASAKLPKVSGNGSFDFGFVPALLSYSGPAVLVGKVSCGGKSSSAKANVIFQ